MRLPTCLLALTLLAACAGTPPAAAPKPGASAAPRAGASGPPASRAPGATPAPGEPDVPGGPADPAATPTPTPRPDCRAIFARHAAGPAGWDPVAFKAYAAAAEDPRDPCAQPGACGHSGDPGILFALFDADEDGALSAEEVCDMRSAGVATPKPSPTATPAEPEIPGIVWGTPSGRAF